MFASGIARRMRDSDVYVLNTDAIVEGMYPLANQAIMVVEVSDTTLEADLINDGTGKLGLYARAGIPTAWVVDVNQRCIHVFESPEKGHYRQTQVSSDVVMLNGQPCGVDGLIA